MIENMSVAYSSQAQSNPGQQQPPGPPSAQFQHQRYELNFLFFQKWLFYIK